MKVNWKGVIPAITTPFNADLTVDEGFLAKHSRWMVDEGSVGLVPVGSLGESATLDRAEKRKVIETCVKAVGDRVPIIPGIAALSTAEAVNLAQDAKAIGCSGLMVLPPYVYSTDWREMKAHVRAIIAATDLPCMLYNNPIAYKTDFLPKHIVELAGELPNLHAVKESSADLRRVMAIRALRARACRSWSASTTRSSKRSMPARSDGSRDSSTPSPPSRSRSTGMRWKDGRPRRSTLYAVVPAALAPGHGGEVRAAHQARAAARRHGKRPRPAAAIAACRRGVARSERRDRPRARDASETFGGGARVMSAPLTPSLSPHAGRGCPQGG